MLLALGGNSPYLADLALREAASLRELAARGPDAVVARAMAAIADTPPAARRERVAAALRQAKRQVALATAIADIGGIWALERVTGALSALAEAALGLAVAHLLRAAHEQGELAPARPRRARSRRAASPCSAWASSAPPSSTIPAISTSCCSTTRTRIPGIGTGSGRRSHAWRATWFRSWKRATRMATSSAPICACAPTRPRRRPRSRCPRRSPITRAWGRTGSARR